LRKAAPGAEFVMADIILRYARDFGIPDAIQPRVIAQVLYPLMISPAFLITRIIFFILSRLANQARRVVPGGNRPGVFILVGVIGKILRHKDVL